MKRMKKFLAVLTAATLLATPFTALAAGSNSGSVDSDSYLEGVTPDDVFSVQLPTIPANTYKVVLDPNKLLSTVATNQNVSQNSYDPNATLLFGNASGDYGHSDTSDGAPVVNTSMQDAILTVNVTVTNAKTNPVTFVGSKAAVSANDTTNVYLAVVPGEKGTVSDNALATVSANSPVTAQASAVGTDGKASLTFYIPGQPANFELSQEDDSSVRSGHKYTYAKKSSDLAAWNTASFYLTGASNPNADWKKFNEKSQLTDDTKAENLKVKTVWSVTAATASQKADGANADATTGLATLSEAPFVASKELKANAAGTKYYIETSDTALSKIIVYAKDQYVNNIDDLTKATAVGKVNGTANSSGGTITVLKADLDSLIGSGTGDYVLLFKVGESNETAVYTK